MVVRYIRRHADAMKDNILMEIAAGRKDQDGNPFLGTDDEKFESFLEDLALNRTWASSESILAVQGLYGGTVRVHNPNYEPIVIGEQNEPVVGEGNEPRIEIYYNGLNHYNSVLKNKGGVSVIKVSEVVVPNDGKGKGNCVMGVGKGPAKIRAVGDEAKIRASSSCVMNYREEETTDENDHQQLNTREERREATVDETVCQQAVQPCVLQPETSTLAEMSTPRELAVTPLPIRQERQERNRTITPQKVERPKRVTKIPEKFKDYKL
ncbi:hypothetical protein pipiens_004586 [Culex pipiens pipiens]|uniref:OTU domain-containing protein n=1 Tax=Culex pipiens pipiens TaxID=38569 RepID=A0ABD1CHC7_CULPP